ncbi:hypothetical protein IV203_023339 [Nitzschia inconspicua]|uniref:Uncharacterized protein n=1 Tax=Nitzschia inconspicua TaxID=303405 RepID=A0A9K3KCV8_9STRA|nr:hypothetical protein IV203_023339 [Nitzschia inconspicua]
MKDKNKNYQLAQEVKARLKLESRVGIMEWVLNMELTDKLKELKELLHQMPQVAENEVARLEMLGRIQMMEHAIFFGLTESMETAAEI